MLNFNMIKSMSNELSKSNTEAYAEWLDAKEDKTWFQWFKGLFYK